MKLNYKGFMREMIQRNPVTISPDASFSEARSIIITRGTRHLPVVDHNHKVVGIVTDADIRKASPSEATTLSIYELEYLLHNLKVSAFMTPKDKLITITPDTLIEKQSNWISAGKSANISLTYKFVQLKLPPSKAIFYQNSVSKVETKIQEMEKVS